MSFLVRFSTMMQIKISRCPGFLCTTSYRNTIQTSANSRACIGFGASSNGKYPTAQTQLTANDLEIFRLHKEACQAEKRFYIDPSTGYKVFTAFAHLKRGKCCGSACRHCPYGQVNVEDPAKKKHFNSLFYV